MSSSRSIKRLVSVISYLGGPTILPDDLEWVSDLPSGRSLVDWLANQLDEEVISDADETCADTDLRSQACLAGIALENEEVQLLKRAKGLDTGDSSLERPTIPTMPQGYILPSTLRTRARYLDNESYLLETETKLLKSRLQQTKIAAQQIAQSIKSLQSVIDSADQEVRDVQERLGEVSINADTAISSSVDAALNLLGSFDSQSTSKDNKVVQNCISDAYSLPAPDSEPAPPRKLYGNDLKSSALTFSALDTLRSSIIEHSEAEMHILEEAAKGFSTSEEIKVEACRLHAVFNAGSPKTLIQSALEVAVQKELKDMCQMLGGESDAQASLDALLDEAGPDDPGFDVHVDIKNELNRSWALDQTAILQFRSRILDQTTMSFKYDLLPPLTALHDSLSTRDTQIREAEVLFGSLGEELEELVDDVRPTQELSRSVAPKPADDEDNILEAKLKDLLKGLKDLREAEAPPLVLLDRNDVLHELHSWMDRTKALDRNEEEWVKETRGALSELSATNGPLLSATYAHSPLNTSSPFAFAPEVLAIEKEAQVKAEDLSEIVGRLQREVDAMESGRTKRKLGAFVEKWGRSSHLR